MAIASPKSKEELVRQFKFNPEVNTRLEGFMKAEPGLVQFVRSCPANNSNEIPTPQNAGRCNRSKATHKGQGLVGKARTGRVGQEPKGYVGPEMKPERQSPNAPQPGQELHPQHRYKTKLKLGLVLPNTYLLKLNLQSSRQPNEWNTRYSASTLAGTRDSYGHRRRKRNLRPHAPKPVAETTNQTEEAGPLCGRGSGGSRRTPQIGGFARMMYSIPKRFLNEVVPAAGVHSDLR